MRLLVATAAVVAAGAVVGVVLATGQDPPQPSAQCSQAPTAIVVPGVPTTQAAVVRRDLAKEDITAFEILARDHPKDAVVQFNYATLLFCRGYFADATTAFEQAKKVGRNTYYEVEADNLLHPQYFHPSNGPGYPIFELASARSAPPARHRPAARAAPALGRGDLPRGREAASERRSGPGRGGRRTVQRGRHRRLVLAPRAARHAVPAQPDGAVPPRAPALVDGPAHRGRHASSRSRCSSGRRRRWDVRPPSS